VDWIVMEGSGFASAIYQLLLTVISMMGPCTEVLRTLNQIVLCGDTALRTACGGSGFHLVSVQCYSANSVIKILCDW
jgi:hypothetical protein